ncbi:hypothetical protein EW146_g10039 [Bondarzewia mesenterica]|uniref:Carboxylesterase type B domain-containing protein n=1 Tax=Bondarzewia mesenterica TaxID=1095465 RepID=A0A4V3XC91_9AGAM|nr:hypothetical protein EW146_g10039 [Bondarzewia mesenterica]
MGVHVSPAPEPIVRHASLKTVFTGVRHFLSTSDAPVHQYRGIKYASIPARFRQSKLFSMYSPHTDATHLGPICPQPRGRPIEEELFGFSKDDYEPQSFKQSEFGCLNLNITCPAGLNRESRVPVMMWIHGGGNRGTGSHWLYDGGAFVQSSIRVDKPVIIVAINYRLGVLGFAAGPKMLEANSLEGEAGVGNYGLHDQRKALEWPRARFDILCHLMSRANASAPLFQRAIVQSPLINTIPDVSTAGLYLVRYMSALHLSSLDDLRKSNLDTLLSLPFSSRAVDDNVFFADGWRELLFPESRTHHLHHGYTYACSPLAALARHLGHLQPHIPQSIIIGDCGCESSIFEHPASYWTASGVVRRVKAICGSLAHAATVLYSYDIDLQTPPNELPDRVLELVNDARVAWPVEYTAAALRNAVVGPKSGVWRYIFDQESPKLGTPHHAADLLYLFDTAPPTSASASFDPLESYGSFDTYETFSDSDESESGELFPADSDSSTSSEPYPDNQWFVPSVSFATYTNIRKAIQSHWLAFAYGEAPWSAAQDTVFVFGPEGEAGERCSQLFEGRRRRAVWKRALAPLGVETVRKIGIELGNGPVSGSCMST